MEPIVLILVIMAPIVALIALKRRGAISLSSPGFLAAVALIAGLLGIVIALLCLAGTGSAVVMVGILVSGSILFGSGMISLAILRKPE